MKYFFFALPSAVLIGFANVLLKWRLDHYFRMNIGIFSRESFRLIFDPYVIIGVVATCLSILWWLKIMPIVKVAVVYPMIQAGVIIVTGILSFLFLGEKLNPGQTFGLLCLVFGVTVASFSSS